MMSRPCCAAKPVLALVALVALAPSLPACGHGNMRGKHWATNLPEFDLKACFPREDRDWGEDARVDAMWVAVTDVFPRLHECTNDLFFRVGEFEDKISIELVVQPDHTVVVKHSKTMREPAFDQCVDDAIAMIQLPNSSEAGGTIFKGWYTIEQEGPDSLTVDGSTLGSVVGKVRIRTIDACSCLEPYRDQVPPNLKFKFTLAASDPHPKDIKLATKGIPNDFAVCLRDHLRTIPIGTFDEGVKASYRFKFRNSRVVDLNRLLADGHEALNRRSYAEAEELFTRALAVSPTSPDGLGGLGNVRLENGRLDEALELFMKAEDSEESSTSANNLGRVYLRKRDYPHAEEWAQEGVDRDEASEVAHYNLALAKQGLEEHGDARDAAHTARKLNPKYTPAYVLEAQALVALGQAKDGLELLDQATVLDLQEPAIYEGMARANIELKRYDAANDAVQRGRKKGFDTAYLRYLEGWAHSEQKHGPKAHDAFCEAAKMAPDEVEYARMCEETKAR